MHPADAVELINLVPSASSVATRPGYVAHSSDLSDAVETLVTYHGTTEKLICAADGKIINITAGGTGTNLGTGFTNDRWYTTEFKNRIIFANGADTVRDYDGTTLTNTSLYGPTLITNGDFATSSTWTTGTGWTIGSGVASCDGSQVADSDLTQTPATALVNAKNYIVVFTVSNYSAGNVCAVVGGTEGTDRSADGTYTETITSGAGADFDIRADLNFAGDIDVVSIGRTSEELIFPLTHKGRVYYVKKDSQIFLYAGAGAYAGLTSEFDLSTVAGTGANLSFLIPWSRDGGAGMGDLLACVFEDGMVLVYSGSDPGDTSDWSLVGQCRIGAPLGRRAAAQIGGDAVVLTVDGYVPLSAALTEGQYSEQAAFSFKIGRAAKEAAQSYKGNFGWSSAFFPQGSLWIVNVPISSSQAQQHVRNTVTGAWCKFTDIAATQFAIYDDQLYFCSPDGKIYYLGGASDNGVFINYKAVQAYNHFNEPGLKKHITAVMAHTSYSFPKYFSHKFFSDFNDGTLPEFDDPPESAVSEWDVGSWDVAEWDGSLMGTKVARKPAAAKGYFLAHVFRFKSRKERVNWYGTQMVVNLAGMI